MTSIASRLTTLHQLIAEYEEKYQRKKGSVQLLAVSKNQPIENILQAFNHGQTCFGENYLQEALPKIIALPAAEWHFIGPMQSNKTRKIAEHFAWVHSVDSIKIAERLNEQRPTHLPPLNICIQVNVSDEATKSGISPQEVQALANACVNLPRLRLRGLMAIPAAHTDFLKQRAEFHKLSVLYDDVRKQGFTLDTLSMGMSEDFEAAIAEGASIIRIGRAIWQRD
jgi:pyridoxal phosphate enzyme (YggS family)